MKGKLRFKQYFFMEKSKPLTIELDIFDAPFSPLILAEVEFSSETAANAFLPPPWFGQDVTFDPQYHNSSLSQRHFTKTPEQN